LHLVGQVVLSDQTSQVEVPTGGRTGSVETRQSRCRPRLEEEDVTGFVGLEHAAKHRGFVVDDGDGPIAGSGKGAQPLDLRGDGVTEVARLVHVEQVVVELDPHVSPQRVQPVQCVGAQPLGAARVEPDEDGLLELEPTDHLECTGIAATVASRRASPTKTTS
jgi:hypothetical protein